MSNAAKVRAIRKFASYITGEDVTIPRDRLDNNWNIIIQTATPRLYIPKDLDYELDDGDIEFREDFIARCNIAVSFSDITLSILHECGHWMTRQYFNPEEYIAQLELATTMKEYMAIPCEYMATQWAIDWLKNNIDEAKKFEKEYFME